jgi:hypothetical protein
MIAIVAINFRARGETPPQPSLYFRRPYPTKRPPTYQHVGQVFDANDSPRLFDIEGFIRGVPIPSKCRKNVDWIYG